MRAGFQVLGAVFELFQPDLRPLGIQQGGYRQAQLFPQELHAVEVSPAADAGDRVRAAELARKHARKDVRLIVRRSGDQKIALRHKRGALYVERGAVPLYRHAVERKRKLLAHGAAAVNDRYVVSLGRYLLCNGKTDLSSADNHNFHRRLLLFPKALRALHR